MFCFSVLLFNVILVLYTGHLICTCVFHAYMSYFFLGVATTVPMVVMVIVAIMVWFFWSQLIRCDGSLAITRPLSLFYSTRPNSGCICTLTFFKVLCFHVHRLSLFDTLVFWFGGHPCVQFSVNGMATRWASRLLVKILNFGDVVALPIT